MAWTRRGLIIRLVLYVPLFVILGWRAYVRCDAAAPDETEAASEGEDDLRDKLAPHRKMVTLPDGTQQEIVELTPQEAEEILGHPLPRALDDGRVPDEDAMAATEAAAGAGTTGAAASPPAP